MTGAFDRTRLAGIANCLAIAVAVSLPWSTSATGILIVAWLVVLLPTLSPGDFRIRHDPMTAAGGLPVLLVLLGLVGMLWADVSWAERWKGFTSFPRLLAIPLLLVQFRRSDAAGLRVLAGYLLSCTVLLVVSTTVLAVPSLKTMLLHVDSTIVKNAATQSGEFATCIAGMLYLGAQAVERRRWWWLAGLLVVALGMLANIFFVATGRTALVVLVVLVVLFAVRQLSVRGMLILFAGLVAVAAVGWASSPYLRLRAFDVLHEIQLYETADIATSSGERIEFAKKSLRFIREAPVIGHGTGTITALFTESTIGRTGAAGSATTNPHNQTFAVAIQLGLIGAAVLWAMWLAHLWLFRGPGLAAWIGLVIVAQNIVGSLFNSHLFDFTQGWVYVFGAGVAGGIVLKRRAVQADATP